MCEVKVTDLRRLEHYITDYEKQDIQEGKIVFYGDSSFTRWNPRYHARALEDDIRMKDGSQAIVNRGFGTSTAEEQLYYYPRMIRPLKPRALVLQTYGNDMDLGYTPKEILFLQSRIMDYARAEFPGIRFYVCNVRPLLGPMKKRGAWFENIEEYNSLLAEYCKKHGDVTLVDQTKCEKLFKGPEFAGDYTNLNEDLFIHDEVHFNQEGYDVYRDFFQGVLEDIL